MFSPKIVLNKIEIMLILLSNMETERLHQFCLIADTGSLTKAASVLNISLGGLSKSMKVLEDDLGFQLFMPSGRGLVVSEKGLAIYSKAKQILASLSELQRPETSKPIFRVGALEVFSLNVFGMVIAK